MGWYGILRFLPYHGMGWYEASDFHPTVGWYGILLVSSYGTGDLWDIPRDVAKCGCNVTEYD